eukprot:gene8426-18679_t
MRTGGNAERGEAEREYGGGDEMEDIAETRKWTGAETRGSEEPRRGARSLEQRDGSASLVSTTSGGRYNQLQVAAAPAEAPGAAPPPRRPPRRTMAAPRRDGVVAIPAGTQGMRGMLLRWTMTRGCGVLIGEDGRYYFLTARVMRACGLARREDGGKGGAFVSVVEPELDIRRIWVFDARDSAGGKDPVVTRIERGEETQEPPMRYEQRVLGAAAAGGARDGGGGEQIVAAWRDAPALRPGGA